MDIRFIHMYHVTGVKLEFPTPPPGEVDVVIEAVTPAEDMRELYHYRNNTYPSVSDCTSMYQLI